MSNLFNLQHNLMMALMAVIGKDVFFADNTDKPVEELLVKYCKEMLNKGKVQILISDEMGTNVTEYWVYPNPNGDSIKSIKETFDYVDEDGYFEQGHHVYEFGEGLQIVDEYNI